MLSKDHLQFIWQGAAVNIDHFLSLLNCAKKEMKENSNYSFNFQIKFSNFLLAPMSTHTRKKNHHRNLPHPVLLSCGHTQDMLKQGHVFHLCSLFWICAFLPLLGSWEGKTQKRQVAGENKNKWRQLSPSPSLHPNHLHPPPHSSLPSPAPLPWSP